MKKALSVFLAICMALCFVPMAFAEKTIDAPANAYAEYDRVKVAEKDADTISALNYDQMAGILLDWVDRKIAAAAEDFSSFNVEISEGLTVPVELNITCLDDILGYVQYKDQLGGDFAELDTTALEGLTRANGDINFIFAIIDFMSDNAGLFGKVFSWNYNEAGVPEYKEGVNFDFGKVGEYIESLEDGNEIKTFYKDYLIGNNIQEWFVSGIAGEMNYTPTEGETFDDVINNGILGFVAGVCDKFDLLSEDGLETLNAYDLRTTDVYTLIKNFAGLVQSDNETKINTWFRYLCDTPLRTALKATFGQTAVIGEADDTATEEFKAAYTDLALLNEISGGTVYYRADDGKYYVFTLADGAVTSAKALTWTDSLLNFDPPTVEIWDAEQKVGGAYTPVSAEISDYAPTVYTADYSEYVDTSDLIAEAAEFGVKVTAEELPEAIASIIAAGNGVAMKDKFLMKINGSVFGYEFPDLEISFAEIEAFANKTIADNLPSLQASVDEAVNSAIAAATTAKEALGQFGSFLPTFTGSAKIDSATVSLSYTGYSDEDTFVCEVAAVPAVEITFDGNIWQYAQYAAGVSIPTPYGNITIDQDGIKGIVDKFVASAITNPVATIVVDNLNGSIEGLGDVTALMNFLDTDFAVDTGILDFAGNYDEYKGVIGQVNRVLCDALEMLLSDEGYASLGLTEGGNEYLTDNLNILREKAGKLVGAAKEFIGEETFAAFAEEMNVSAAFASSHGFNAGMVYNLDFSSLENLFVCAIRLACDFLVADDSGVLYDIHEIVENLDTLDAMAIGVFNYALNKAVAEVNAIEEGILATFKYNYPVYTAEQLKQINETANTVDVLNYAENTIMGDITNLAYYAAEWGVDNIANGVINGIIDDLNNESGLDLPHVEFRLNVGACKTWSVTLAGLADRVLGLVDGLYIPHAAENATVYGKLGTLLKAIPVECMFSGTTDLDTIAGYVFTDALKGDFEGVLSLFEVKNDAIAGGVPVTKALINASDYVVDNFFPGTVASENYPIAEDVQETFTGTASDAGIAERNMISIAGRKANLIPCALDLIRETNTLLPYFAQCDHANTEDTEGKASTCLTKGYTSGKKCLDCGAIIPGDELELDPDNHEALEDVTAVAATCTAAGSTAGVKCKCGYTTVTTIDALGHSCTVKQNTEAPTCTTGGYTVYKCVRCPETEKRDVTNALDHEFTVKQNTVEPTCTEGGYTVYKCVRCPETTKKDAVAAKGHTDANDDGWCDDCGAETAPHEEEKVSFFTKIINFFKSIIDWFKNLFK